MSWIKRQMVWLRRKILREKASPEFIARGWAIGMFYGCTIPFGLQLALSIPTAFILKGSKIGASFGTLLTNHFTIWFIYPAQCWVGNRLLGGDLTFAAVENAMKDVLQKQSWESLWQLGGDLVAAFFLGGAILAAVCVPPTYYGVLGYVRRKRARSAKKGGRSNGRSKAAGKGSVPEKSGGCNG